MAAVVLLALGVGCAVTRDARVPPAEAPESAQEAEQGPELWVTNTEDIGAGSLRHAILTAGARPGADTIRFDSTTGPFATPQTIVLTSELPELVGELTVNGYIEDRLWSATGVTVSGANAHRAFTVAASARITIESLTVADGRATQGGGIVNHGELLLKGVTLLDNVALEAGGGVANLGGALTVINSTFVGNRAVRGGGGVADHDGTLTVTNATFSENAAKRGGGLLSTGTLLVRNTILANSVDGADCVALGELDPASTHNLIEANAGCGTPITSDDPRFQQMGFYNGPTRTLPLGGGSPAINLGDNASAVDENGQPLRWDQRGNGDPRFVAGITDIGAFEVQASPVLTVDTVDDIDLRGCRGTRPDCSLRGAIALANATPGRDVITFDPYVFAAPTTIRMTNPLPTVTTDLILDAAATVGVRVQGDFATLKAGPDVALSLINIQFDGWGGP